MDHREEKRKDKPWKMEPEDVDAPPYAPSQDEMHAAGKRAELNLWRAVGLVSPSEDRRFAGPYGWRLFWKLPAYTFGAGVSGVLLILAQLLLAEGAPLYSLIPDAAGLTRLGMLIFGAWLLFVACPLYKPADWTPEKQREIDRDRDYFRRKRRF